MNYALSLSDIKLKPVILGIKTSVGDTWPVLMRMFNFKLFV